MKLPANRTVDTTNPKGVAVTYAAAAADAVDGSVSPCCSPASGSVFPVGSTIVTCTARDSRGNTSSGEFTGDGHVHPASAARPHRLAPSAGTSFTITNRGNAGAGVFVVTVQGAGTFTIRGLAAGASVTRTVTCASIQRQVTVDAQNQVTESNEANNTARIPPC